MAQPFHLPLPGVGERAAVNQLADIGQQGFLIGSGNLLLQLIYPMDFMLLQGGK